MSTDMKALRQDWEESERGWGVRPDGFTLHLHEADRLAFITAHWDSLPHEAPDEYSRPSGDPVYVEATQEQWDLLIVASTEGKRGIWG